MATGTAWYNLTKPASTENYDLSTWNTNLDMIDEQMHQNETESFTGATDLANGTVGNVPAPQIADKEKFLKGDGTWDTPSGGGSSTLDGLTDVDLSSLTNGQVLKYNSTTQKWENADESGGSSAEEMTLDEYNALTTDQKNDGTIRFIPNGSTISATTAIDMSSISSLKESAMDASSTSDQITISWDGGMQIGGTFYYATPIDVTSWDKISFDLTTSSCYGGGSSAQQARWNVQIGLQASVPSSVQDIDATNSRWAAVVDYANANTVYSNQELDVSELTGQYYLVINAHGWNAIIDDFVLEKIGVTYQSQIKYMSKTYAEEISGGSSAEEMTLDEYNALTTDQKNDGTIRFIPESSVGVTTPIDMLNPTNISESSNIVITPSEKSVEMTWDTSTSTGIAATFYYSQIDVTNYDYLAYDLVTGDSYDSLHPGSENPIRDLGIGLCSSAPSTWAYAPNINWTIWNRYEVTDTNKDLGTQTLDVSELSGEYYLVIAGVAWEATISNLKYATSGGNKSQIKYMDKTYGIGSGSDSNIVIVSRTDNTNGYAWLMPCDSNGNPLKPSEVTLLSIFAEADMSGAPPYYNGLNVCVDTDSDRYLCKLYNTQTGGYASDGTYSVDYTVAYIPNSGGSSGGGSSSHTYSTTEQKVGTWIDGSDVWEKTINIEETTIHGNASFTIDIETNIGVLIECSLMYRDIELQNGRWNPLDNVTDQINYDMYRNRLYLESNGTLIGEFGGSSGAVTICGVIRYTKVSTS